MDDSSKKHQRQGKKKHRECRNCLVIQIYRENLRLNHCKIPKDFLGSFLKGQTIALQRGRSEQPLFW